MMSEPDFRWPRRRWSPPQARLISLLRLGKFSAKGGVSMGTRSRRLRCRNRGENSLFSGGYMTESASEHGRSAPPASRVPR